MITTLVLKAIRACNLRCPYCYYINEKTEDYGSAMSIETAKHLYSAFSSYLSPSNTRAILIWHGGEPLVLGRNRFQALLDAQNEFFAPGTVMNCLQTNGVLIDDDWVDFIERNELQVGLSLDGPAAVHDRLRPSVSGEPTHEAVIRAMNLLGARGIPFGVLAVADPGADGAAVVRHFREIGVASCDLLIPMTNHALQRRLPVLDGSSSRIDMGGLTRYLVGAFREWIGADDPSVRIRLFEAMIFNALGISQTCTNAGVSDKVFAQVAVVETNGDLCMDTEFGEIERNGFGQEYRLGLNVVDDGLTFEKAERVLGERIASRGLGRLPDECQRCPVRSVCRGSHPGSRFDDGDGSFNHRSAHCAAMYELSAEVVGYLCRNGYDSQLFDPVLRELQTTNQ